MGQKEFLQESICKSQNNKLTILKIEGASIWYAVAEIKYKVYNKNKNHSNIVKV